jgi:hypothetical protein
MRIIDALQDMGFTFKVRAGNVRVTYPHPVPPPAAVDLLKALPGRKQQALRYLGEIEWRAAVMRKQVPEHPRPILLLRAHPEKPLRDGHCYSCGLPLTDPDRQACDACVRAMWTALDDWRRHDDRAQ